MIGKRYSPKLCAVITGLDLLKCISDNEIKFIKNSFHEFQVLFFQEQVEIFPEYQISLGKHFFEYRLCFNRT